MSINSNLIEENMNIGIPYTNYYKIVLRIKQITDISK